MFFCPQDAKSHVGDYHKVFNATNYVDMFQNQLLPNLTEPSMIIFDNASYHKTLPLDAVRPHKMKKADVLASLERNGVSYEDGITAVEAKRVLKQWIN